MKGEKSSDKVSKNYKSIYSRKTKQKKKFRENSTQDVLPPPPFYESSQTYDGK